MRLTVGFGLNVVASPDPDDNWLIRQMKAGPDLKLHTASPGKAGAPGVPPTGKPMINRVLAQVMRHEGVLAQFWHSWGPKTKIPRGDAAGSH